MNPQLNANQHFFTKLIFLLPPSLDIYRYMIEDGSRTRYLCAIQDFFLFYKHQCYIEFLATEKNRIQTHVKNTIFFTCENIIFTSQSKPMYEICLTNERTCCKTYTL